MGGITRAGRRSLRARHSATAANQTTDRATLQNRHYEATAIADLGHAVRWL